MFVTTAAPLAVRAEQSDDRRHSLLGVRGPFQGEAQQVHPGQPQLLGGGVSEHSLVADRHPVLVGAHLGAEHPIGPTEQNGIGLGDLVDLDPCAGDPRPDRVRATRLPVEKLGLVRVAVGVLGEQNAIAVDDDHGVAHAGDRTPLPNGCRPLIGRPNRILY